jgi:hypothetical protein
MPKDAANSASTQKEEARPSVFRAGKLPPGLPDWFRQLDKDGDGQIGLYEWRAGGRSLEEFARIDRNDDGFLTPEEVLYYLAQQSEVRGQKSEVRGPKSEEKARAP